MTIRHHISRNVSTPKGQGFAVVEILLIAAIAVVLGGTGFVAWREFSAAHKSASTSHTTTSDTPSSTMSGSGSSNGSTSAATPDVTVHNVSITLTKKSDVGLLPSFVPLSFVNYIETKLPNDQLECGDDGNSPDVAAAATYTYKIDAISGVNVKGEVMNCTGVAAGAVWAVESDDNSWDEISFQDIPSCNELSNSNGANIYSEFMPNCVDKNGNVVGNPNGSIASSVK